ncbi:hypothetical protein [Pseudomonas fluorescens]|uniref:Uncharacterized protein n=1 Tax=Pseudomonas fluorescens TaxID=294 RepID=A0A5E7P6I8_PSEFL|nr:hypothetical protein [Pseudomonas fluorescens]VVP44971.1 hypothetical protein PS880_05046 [Pseudomonas fluorescens]
MPNTQIQMPTNVFVEAVHMATLPWHKRQESHPSVERIIDWWNTTSEPEFQCAYGFALYVQFGEEWLSGNPEEGWVDAPTWAKNSKPKAQASLASADMTFVFFKHSVDASEFAFDARAVDGSEGFSGGKGADETSGNTILTRYAHEALCLVPERFPALWRSVCGLATMPSH